MKKLLACLLAIALASSLVACAVGNTMSTDENYKAQVSENGETDNNGGSGGNGDNGGDDKNDNNDNNDKNDKEDDDNGENGDHGDKRDDGDPDKAKNYAEAYNQLTNIQNALQATGEGINEKHNDNLEYGDAGYTGDYSFMLLYSVDLAFTATLSEDPAAISGVETAYGFFGMKATVEHPAPHEYIITYTNEEGDLREDECKFDQATGSLSFVEKKNGKAFYFFEFLNLGDGRYAYQTEYERAFVTFKDGVVLAFLYSAYQSWQEDEPYNYADVSVFPGGAGVDEGWVFADGVDSYRIAYRYDGETLKIDANPKWHNSKHIVITV